MHEYELGLINVSLDYLEIGYEDCVMAELGNQRIRHLSNYWDRAVWPGGGKDGIIKGSSKYYHTALGVRHDSFDWNGMDGAKKVRILGEQYQVRARIARINGLSAHADKNELFQWISRLSSAPRRVFIVHGEPQAVKHLGQFLREKTGWEITTPEYKTEALLE